MVPRRVSTLPSEAFNTMFKSDYHNRLIFIIIITSLFSCQSLNRILPSKAVLDAKSFQQKAAEDIKYKAQRVSMPYMPFIMFGVKYKHDWVISPSHDRLDMIEIAEVQLPKNKTTWVVKESLQPHLNQVLLYSDDKLGTAFPEIPLQMQARKLDIMQNEDEKSIKLQTDYNGSFGQRVMIEATSKKKLKKLKKRNGSTMGHSKEQVLAILDLPERTQAKVKKITIDDQHQKVNKILGLKNFSFLVRQTQAGISTSNYLFSRDSQQQLNFEYIDKSINEEWTFDELKQDAVLKTENAFRKSEYHFTKEKEYWLLTHARVVDLLNNNDVLFEISFLSPLPDLRYQFDGKFRTSYVMNVNEQFGHATGQIELEWTNAAQIKLTLLPEEPKWTKDRPITNIIRIQGDNVGIESLIMR